MTAPVEDIREYVAETPDSAEILETEGLCPTAPSATRAASLTEAAKDVIQVDTLVKAPSAVSRLRKVAEVIVLLALLGIAQDLVGFVYFLEALGGLRVIRIGVGVVLLGKLSIGLFDLVRGGFLPDTEDLVVVFLRHIYLAA
jgi:hypothetical protein